MQTITINIGDDGTVSPSKVMLGNRYENNDAKLEFIIPAEYETFNKYLIFVKASAARAILHNRAVSAGSNNLLPIANNSITVSSALTWSKEDWYLYVMCREQELDLNQEDIDISAKPGERVSISDGFVGVINPNHIDPTTLQNAPLDSNLQTVYDDLFFLKNEIKKKTRKWWFQR